MVPQRCSRPYVTLHGKRDFADVIKLKILYWAIILDYPGGPNIIPSESRGLLQPAGTGPLRAERSGDTEEETAHKVTEVSTRVKAELTAFCILGPNLGTPPGAQDLPSSLPSLQGSPCLDPAFRGLSVSSAISRSH